MHKGTAARKRIPLTAVLILALLLVCLAGCNGTEAEQVSDNTGSIPLTSEEVSGALVHFTAETLDGSEFSYETLAAADLTVLNIWQTSCPPCIREMPELAELEKELPDRVRFVTWCLDGSYDTEGTRSILEDAGFEGTTILDGDGDLLTLLGSIRYTPTTVFIDSEGKLVGEPVIGAYKQPKTSYIKKINEVLSALGKEAL